MGSTGTGTDGHWGTGSTGTWHRRHWRARAAPVLAPTALRHGQHRYWHRRHWSYRAAPVLVVWRARGSTGTGTDGTGGTGSTGTGTDGTGGTGSTGTGTDGTGGTGSSTGTEGRYTKLDASGASLASAAGSWTCVKDNTTSLVWEIKSNTAGDPRYREWLYQLGHGGMSPAGGSYPCAGVGTCDSDAYIQLVNSMALCGKTNWRLPTILELVGTSGPTTGRGKWKIP
ncbi:MAG: DUF1566 domain-containing protein [Thiothrix sp.]